VGELRGLLPIARRIVRGAIPLASWVIKHHAWGALLLAAVLTAVGAVTWGTTAHTVTVGEAVLGTAAVLLIAIALVFSGAREVNTVEEQLKATRTARPEFKFHLIHDSGHASCGRLCG
jgi:hypothetical protein